MSNCIKRHQAQTEKAVSAETKTLIEALLAKAKALDEKATPGPWMWEIRTGIRDCKLMTAHSGRYYVMDFERWGMQDACPRLQVYERYSGPVTERGSKGMERADKMARSYPGREHHRGYDDYIDHPDAMFIAEARALVPKLIEAVETLHAENAEKDKQLAAAVEDLDAVIKIACEHDAGVCDYCADNGEECHGDDPRWHCPTMEGRKWIDDDAAGVPQEAGEGGG